MYGPNKEHCLHCIFNIMKKYHICQWIRVFRHTHIYLRHFIKIYCNVRMFCISNIYDVYQLWDSKFVWCLSHSSNNGSFWYSSCSSMGLNDNIIISHQCMDINRQLSHSENAWSSFNMKTVFPGIGNPIIKMYNHTITVTMVITEM